jgi:hypothetical protein
MPSRVPPSRSRMARSADRNVPLVTPSSRRRTRLSNRCHCARLPQPTRSKPPSRRCWPRSRVCGRLTTRRGGRRQRTRIIRSLPSTRPVMPWMVCGPRWAAA